MKIKPSVIPRAQPSASDEEDYCQSAEEFYEGLKETIHDVNEAIAGRKQLKTFEKFLAELRSSD